MLKRITWSASRKKSDAMIANTNTIAVVISVSRREGHVTSEPSPRTCCRNSNGLIIASSFRNQIFPKQYLPGNEPNDGTSPRLSCPNLSPTMAASFHANGPGFAFPSACQLAGVEGLEPPTPGFGDRCSTN